MMTTRTKRTSLRAIIGISCLVLVPTSALADLYTYAFKDLSGRNISYTIDSDAAPIGQPKLEGGYCRFTAQENCSLKGLAYTYKVQDLTIDGQKIPNGIVKISSFKNGFDDYNQVSIGSYDNPGEIYNPRYLSQYVSTNVTFSPNMSYLLAKPAGSSPSQSPIQAGNFATSGTLAVTNAGSSNLSLYSAMLGYVKAQFDYSGALYSIFQSMGLSQEQMAGLSNSFAALSRAELNLVEVLQSKVSAA